MAESHESSKVPSDDDCVADPIGAEKFGRRPGGVQRERADERSGRLANSLVLWFWTIVSLAFVAIGIVVGVNADGAGSSTVASALMGFGFAMLSALPLAAVAKLVGGLDVGAGIGYNREVPWMEAAKYAAPRSVAVFVVASVLFFAIIVTAQRLL